jgi:hypothetical protein
VYGLGSYVPNLIAPALVILGGSWSFKASHILSAKSLNTAAKNTYQANSKFQKTAGYVISYAYNVPPIGAPNAAETPAA